jgi:pimeloyl-ACP methyl ester carboxylesterase
MFNDQTPSPAIQTIDIEAVRIEYLEYGNPAGEPLILLHGFPDAPLAWRGVLKQMDLGGLRVLVPWLRGFGGSQVMQPDRVGGQEAALGHDLLGFADALGITDFHLAGHDWGARASYAACVFAPERIRSLLALATPYVMYGGRAYPPEQVRGNWYQWYFQLEPARPMLTEHAEDFCRELWNSWSPEWGFLRRDFAEVATWWKGPQFAATVLHYYRTRWGGALGLRAYAELQARLDAKPKTKLATPTIYVQGGADACDLPACSEEQDGFYTGPYERVLLKGVGHFPHREDPKTIAKLLIQQIDRTA